MLCVGFIITLNLMTPNKILIQSTLFQFLGFNQSQILTSIWDRWNPKYWPNLSICCLLCFHTLSTHWLQLLHLFGVMLPKSVFGTDAIPNTDLICRYAVCSIHAQLNDSQYWNCSVLCFQNTKRWHPPI